MSVQRGWSSLLILFIVIFAFWWGISVIAQNGDSSENSPIVAQNMVPYNGGPLIVHHTLNGQVNNYTGTLTLPSQCDTLGSGITTTSDDPAHVTLMLTLAGTPGCISSEPDSADFMMTISTKEGQPPPVFDGVTVNEAIVASTLVEDK